MEYFYGNYTDVLLKKFETLFRGNFQKPQFEL